MTPLAFSLQPLAFPFVTLERMRQLEQAADGGEASLGKLLKT